MDDSDLYKTMLQTLNEAKNEWNKSESFYTKVKGLIYITMSNNKMRQSRIDFLKQEIEKRDQQIKNMIQKRDEQIIRNHYLQNKLNSLEKKIKKLKKSEDEYNRINSIKNPIERVNELINLSNRTYEKLEKKRYFSPANQVYKQIHVDSKNTIVLDKNGTYYNYPLYVDSFYHNAQILLLSFFNEPQNNDVHKIKEILYQFDFSEEESQEIIQKYKHNLPI